MKQNPITLTLEQILNALPRAERREIRAHIKAKNYSVVIDRLDPNKTSTADSGLESERRRAVLQHFCDLAVDDYVSKGNPEEAARVARRCNREKQAASLYDQAIELNLHLRLEEIAIQVAQEKGDSLTLARTYIKAGEVETGVGMLIGIIEEYRQQKRDFSGLQEELKQSLPRLIFDARGRYISGNERYFSLLWDLSRSDPPIQRYKLALSLSEEQALELVGGTNLLNLYIQLAQTDNSPSMYFQAAQLARKIGDNRSEGLFSRAMIKKDIIPSKVSYFL